MLDLLRHPAGIWVGAQKVEALLECIAPYVHSDAQAEKLEEMLKYYRSGRYKDALRAGINIQLNVDDSRIPIYASIADFPDPLDPPDYIAEAGRSYGALSAHQLTNDELQMAIAAVTGKEPAKTACHIVHGLLYYKLGRTLTKPEYSCGHRSTDTHWMGGL